jgi:hypothetical protein
MEHDIELKLSSLAKTWIFDIDGTILKHNGYKNNNEILLPGVKEFFNKYVKDCDTVILTTGRKTDIIDSTKMFLLNNGIRFDHIIYNLPLGERVLLNDKKDSGLLTAYSINLNRDSGLKNISITINEGL